VSLRLSGMLLLVAAACHPSVSAQRSGSSYVREPDYCGMALSALRATIASNQIQPYGLEDVCVRRLASTEGTIFVDARVWESERSSPVTAPTCVGGGFRVRFDSAHFEKAPTDGVVLLMMKGPTTGPLEFSAVVERPDWPSKRPGVFGLSPCGSAFGTIRHSPAGWTATVVDPPRQAGEL